MTGEIIYFQGHLDLKRGQLCREQTVSRHAILAPAIPARSRAGGEAGRRILPMLPGSERRADLADDGEGDPQPDIDCETLDRMYRELNSGA
jgi:hypothetical protein